MSMFDCTTYDESGRIVFRISVVDENEADMNGVWVAGHWDERAYFVYDGQVVPRAPIATPDIAPIAKDSDLTFSDLPEGTEVYVDGDLVGSVDDSNTLTLTFGAAGVWPVRLDPPFPWLGIDFEVTVQ